MISIEYSNKHKIILQAQIKLIEKGWIFEFTHGGVNIFKSNIALMIFQYSNYNNDILSALASAILWAIDKEGE